MSEARCGASFLDCIRGKDSVVGGMDFKGTSSHSSWLKADATASWEEWISRVSSDLSFLIRPAQVLHNISK
jgi:hypothetical protein